MSRAGTVGSMLRSSSTVDPEILRAGIAALLGGAERASIEGVVDRSLAVLAQTNSVDMPGLERHTASRPASEIWALAEEQVAQTWLAVEDLQQALAPFAAQHQEYDDASSASGLVAPATPPSSLGNQPKDERPQTAILSRIADTAWTMSYMLRSDVDAFRRRLPVLAKIRDGWGVLGALQEHLAHLQCMVEAILNGIFESLPDATRVPLQGESAQLAVARELRARVFELRERVLSIEAVVRGTPASSWREPLAELGGLIDEFLFTPAFAWMRANDKRSFLEQQQMIHQLLAMWSPLRAEPSRQAVAGIARFLEALEVINQRECLVTHDRQALLRVISSLEDGEESSPLAVAQALSALDDAQGRDSQLDRLLTQTLDPSAPPPLTAILQRAREVLAEMGEKTEVTVSATR